MVTVLLEQRNGCVCVNLIKTVETRQDIHGSDHAPLCVTLGTVPPLQLLQRATLLGLSHFEFTKRHELQKSVCYKDIDVDRQVNALQVISPPTVGGDADGRLPCDNGHCYSFHQRPAYCWTHMGRGKFTLKTTLEHQ